jgi:hypothetical protein
VPRRASPPPPRDGRAEHGGRGDCPDAGRAARTTEPGAIGRGERARGQRRARTSERSGEQDGDDTRVGDDPWRDDERRVHGRDRDEAEQYAAHDLPRGARKSRRVRPDDAVQESERKQQRKILRESSQGVDERHDHRLLLRRA